MRGFKVKKIFLALLSYLKDWKNILSHSLVGIGLVAIAAFSPVSWYHRIAILIGVIGLNTMRMMISKRLKEQKNGNEE
jgi:hypothetical protein